jgi:hypothetical protein
MASKSKRAKMQPKKNYKKSFLNWSIFFLFVKIIVIINIQAVNLKLNGTQSLIVDGIWPGSDAEAYLTGFSALSRDGFFSKDGILNYWPAGYPIIIWALSLLGKAWVLTSLAIIQSFIFSFAVFSLGVQIARTRLRSFAYPIFILTILNPTLSLTSLWIGYENLTASGFIIILAIIIKDLVEKNSDKFIKYLIIISSISSLMVFMQPRLIISVVLINTIWIIVHKGLKVGVLLVILSLFITLVLPVTLVYRNFQATGQKVISTNLGVTMNLGAGDKATGSYRSEGQGVPCEVSVSDPVKADSQKVKCVLNWYLANPIKSIKLFYNKTIYFWSPWSGPEGNGTMGRNPWLKISPVKNISSTPAGDNLVYGVFGKLISWLWLLGGLALIFYGYLILWRQNSLERLIGNIAMITVSTNWLISLISIGDHRFRIPIMGMSLFLQAVGLRTLFKGGKAPMVEGPALR